MALLSAEDSNDFQKRMRAVLTIHLEPSPIRSFHLSATLGLSLKTDQWIQVRGLPGSTPIPPRIKGKLPQHLPLAVNFLANFPAMQLRCGMMFPAYREYLQKLQK